MRLTRAGRIAGPSARRAAPALASRLHAAEPGTFATPEEAVPALDDLVGTGDEKRSDEIFGPGSLDLFRPGDPADDKAAAQRSRS